MTPKPQRKKSWYGWISKYWDKSSNKKIVTLNNEEIIGLPILFMDKQLEDFVKVRITIQEI